MPAIDTKFDTQRSVIAHAQSCRCPIAQFVMYPP